MRLETEFKLVPLTSDVLGHLLALGDVQATRLCVPLNDVGIETVGSLLTASAKISESASGFSAIGKLSTIGEGYLQDIAGLRDKVSSSRGAFAWSSSLSTRLQPLKLTRTRSASRKPPSQVPPSDEPQRPQPPHETTNLRSASASQM